MQKLMKAMHKNEKGFTLVELMVVVVIIGILVAIAIPIFNAVQTNAANRAHESNIRILYGAAMMLIADDSLTEALGTYTAGTPGDLDEHIEVWPDVPDRADTNPAELATLIGTGEPTVGTDQTYEVVIRTPTADDASEVVINIINIT